MEPKLVTRAQESAVGLGDCFVPKSVSTINQLWNEFVPRLPEINNKKEGSLLGICCRQHESFKCEAGSIIYIAAAPVSHVDEQLPANMVSCILTAGNYAVFTHKGSLQELPKTCDYIWNDWASSGKLKLRQAPDFELYDDRFNPVKLEGEIDIYIPIE